MHQNESVHVWHQCARCSVRPIRGMRYECQQCVAGPDRDYCQGCFECYERGNHKHECNWQVPPPRMAPPQFLGTQGSDLNNYRHLLIDSPPQIPQAPAISRQFIFRPEFHTETASYFGPYAFALAFGEGCFIVTALHLLDEVIRNAQRVYELGSKKRAVPEPQNLVKSVTLYDAGAPKWVFAELGCAKRMLHLPDTSPLQEEPYCDGDIAAFVDPTFALTGTHVLASEMPGPGEWIWLVVRSQIEQEIVCVPAEVMEASPFTMVYRFHAREMTLKATSGAPLLNSEGEIVGINVGGGYLEGFTFGYANPATGISRRLNGCIDIKGASNQEQG